MNYVNEFLIYHRHSLGKVYSYSGQCWANFYNENDFVIRKNSIFELKEVIAQRQGVSVLQEKEAALHHTNIIRI